MGKDAIQYRSDLVSLKSFAAMFDVDARTLQRVIQSRQIECEVIKDGTTERYYVNLDAYMNHANSLGLTGLGLFRKLARLCRK